MIILGLVFVSRFESASVNSRCSISRISSPASFGVASFAKRTNHSLSNDLPVNRSRELPITP
jgi:hypothetical protein